MHSINSFTFLSFVKASEGALTTRGYFLGGSRLPAAGNVCFPRRSSGKTLFQCHRVRALCYTQEYHEENEYYFIYLNLVIPYTP